MHLSGRQRLLEFRDRRRSRRRAVVVRAEVTYARGGLAQEVGRQCQNDAHVCRVVEHWGRNAHDTLLLDECPEEVHFALKVWKALELQAHHHVERAAWTHWAQARHVRQLRVHEFRVQLHLATHVIINILVFVFELIRAIDCKAELSKYC